jgi:hypothetical protein
MKLKVLAGVFLVAAIAVGGAGALAAKPQATTEAKDTKPAVGGDEQAKDEPAKAVLERLTRRPTSTP